MKGGQVRKWRIRDDIQMYSKSTHMQSWIKVDRTGKVAIGQFDAFRLNTKECKRVAGQGIGAPDQILVGVMSCVATRGMHGTNMVQLRGVSATRAAASVAGRARDAM